MRLSQKTILITAAAQGMGRASAIACAAEGAKVIATDIDEAALSTLNEYEGIETHRLDVTDAVAIEAFVSALPDLDGIFNCAGIVAQGSLLDVTDEDWLLSMDINVTSMIRISRAALPGMLRRAEQTGSASIVNMASMASSIKGFQNRTVYGTTKAAVIGLTKSIAADFVDKNLRCNAVCPGTVETPSLRGRIASAADPVKAEKEFIARQPMGRLAQVEDITPLVIYLLSNESSFVSGQAILVDGGVTI